MDDLSDKQFVLFSFISIDAFNKLGQRRSHVPGSNSISSIKNEVRWCSILEYVSSFLPMSWALIIYINVLLVGFFKLISLGFEYTKRILFWRFKFLQLNMACRSTTLKNGELTPKSPTKRKKPNHSLKEDPNQRWINQTTISK